MNTNQIIQTCKQLHQREIVTFTHNLVKSDTGKKKMKEQPSGWQKLTLNTCSSKWKKEHTAMSILTGEVSGIFMVDIDDAEKWLMDQPVEYTGMDTVTETTIRSDECFHFYFKFDPRFAKSVVGINGYIDIRSNGGISYCAPSACDGRHYKWLPGQSFVDREVGEIPDWLANMLLDGMHKPKTDTISTILPPTAPPILTLNDTEKNFVRELLKIISPDEARSCWIQTGMYLSRHGFPIDTWLEWSKQSEHWDEGECRRHWPTLGLYNYSEGTLRFWAKKCSPAAYAELTIEGYEKAYKEDRLMEVLNKELVYLARMGKAQYLLLDNDGEFCPKSKSDLEEHYANASFDIEVEKQTSQGTLTVKKPLHVFDYWRKNRQRREHGKIIFHPSLEYDGNDYNTFTGFSITRALAATEAHLDITPLLTHIRVILCEDNPTYYEYFLNWCAHVVQKPEKKTGVAILLRSSAEGAGKGIATSMLLRIIGNCHSAQVNEPNSVFGTFNQVLSGKVLLVLDEAFFGGNNRDKGLVKGLITEDVHTIRSMYCNPRPESSFLNMIFNSNENWVIPADDGSRRYCAMEVNNKWAGVHTDESREYFERIAAVSDHAFANFLYTRDISEFDPGKVPITRLLNEQAEEGYCKMKKWWKSCLDAGHIVGNDALEFGEWLPKDAVYEAYRDATTGGYGNCEMKCVFWKKMLKNGVEFQQGRKSERHESELGGISKIYRVWKVMFQNLADARSTWETHVRHSVEWPDMEEVLIQ